MAFFSTGSGTASAEGIAPPDQRVLLVGSGSKLVVATVAECSPLVSVTELSISDTPNTVLCAAVSPSNNLVAVCTDDKTLAAWKKEVGGVKWTRLGVRVLPKRAMVLCFTRDDVSLVVGDKTGEACLYSLGDWTGCGAHLLGHFSMLLDMVLSPSNSHVITCDRDEKIRISKFPNSYNIECFCLGHTEFVSSICLCPKWPHLLLSGSGDGTVKVWEWGTGRLLGSEQVGRVRDSEGATDDADTDVGEIEAVTKVCCSSQDPPLVVASVENSSQLTGFLVSHRGDLSKWGQIQTSATPWDITFDWSDNLWVCQNAQPEPVMCYQWRQNSLAKLSCDESPLLMELSKWNYFEDVEASVKDWGQMRKHLFDNMESYLARKEERLKSKQPKLSTGSSSHNDMVKLDCSSTQTPPSKKSKLDMSCEHS